MKLSRLQIFWIMFTFTTGNMLLISVGPAISEAKQDAWISIILATILGILIAFTSSKVALLYPNQSFIEYSKTILGKWIGSMILISYFIQWYSVIGIVLGQFADFTITILLPNTPPWVLILTMVVLIVYGTYVGGIEGIGRYSEVFGPIVFFMVIVTVILSVQDIELQKILPVYSDTGLLQIMKGTLRPMSFLGESVMMLMLVSFMDHPKQGSNSAVLGVALAGTLVSVSTFFSVTLFGPAIASKLKFPAFEAIRFISVMGFIQNVEIIAVLVWILSVFVKLSLFLFLASYGTAKWLKIKDWRKVIWFVCAFSIVLALIHPNISVFGMKYSKNFYIPYVFPVNAIGIPLLLLIVGKIRIGRKSYNSH